MSYSCLLLTIPVTLNLDQKSPKPDVQKCQAKWRLSSRAVLKGPAYTISMCESQYYISCHQQPQPTLHLLPSTASFFITCKKCVKIQIIYNHFTPIGYTYPPNFPLMFTVRYHEYWYYCCLLLITVLQTLVMVCQ